MDLLLDIKDFDEGGGNSGLTYLREISLTLNETRKLLSNLWGKRTIY